MEALAEAIVADLEPDQGWQRGDSQQRLLEIVLTLLEQFDTFTAEEIMEEIVSVMKAEYGE